MYGSKIHKSASGYKAAKDGVTIFFCWNASRDYIFKPLVIIKSKILTIFLFIGGPSRIHIHIYRRNVVKGEASILLLKDDYSQTVQLAHSLGGEGLDDFTEEDITELVANKEQSEDDLTNMINETNDCDNDPDEDELESATFTAKFIREEFELERKLAQYDEDKHV